MKKMLFSCFGFVASALLCLADDEKSAEGSVVPALDFQFEGKDEVSWSAVNDGVMGGISQGGPEVKEGHLLFSGELSLENNGGFSSFRSKGGPWDLTGAEGMTLRVMGDGRTYSLRLSTDALHRGDRIAYQGEFETKEGEWLEVEVPFASLKASHHGNALEGPPINLANVTEVGIILADGKAGDFELKVDWMKTYEETVRSSSRRLLNRRLLPLRSGFSHKKRTPLQEASLSGRGFLETL